MGPLITGEHRDKVAGYLAGAEAEGATVVVDGRDRRPSPGFFLNPSLIDHVKPGMKPATTTRSSARCCPSPASHGYDEASQLINDNQYGNGTAIFTRDGGRRPPVPVRRPGRHGRHQRARSRCRSATTASAAGRRPVRRQHMYGPDGINFYTRTKVVTSRWPDPRDLTVDLGFPQNR
jgi:malonate-semialdehyde dehydrogenase (acetylating)/methylmalonate-semialdehyde dehydrogenase